MAFWFYLTYFLTFYLAFYLGIYSDILPGICSGPGVRHCPWSWRYGLGPMVPTVTRTSWQEETRKEAKEERQREEGRVAPLSKSRDPHLAGGEILTWLNSDALNAKSIIPTCHVYSTYVLSWVNLLQRAFKKGHPWRSKAACFFKSCNENVQHHRQKAKSVFLLYYYALLECSTPIRRRHSSKEVHFLLKKFSSSCPYSESAAFWASEAFKAKQHVFKTMSHFSRKVQCHAVLSQKVSKSALFQSCSLKNAYPLDFKRGGPWSFSQMQHSVHDHLHIHR